MNNEVGFSCSFIFAHNDNEVFFKTLIKLSLNYLHETKLF